MTTMETEAGDYILHPRQQDGRWHFSFAGVKGYLAENPVGSDYFYVCILQPNKWGEMVPHTDGKSYRTPAQATYDIRLRAAKFLLSIKG